MSFEYTKGTQIFICTPCSVDLLKPLEKAMKRRYGCKIKAEFEGNKLRCVYIDYQLTDSEFYRIEGYVKGFIEGRQP
jgi:hypothetical protein